MKKTMPSIDLWMKEAKTDPETLENGMFLVHNGTVRKSPKAKVRQGIDLGTDVDQMTFRADQAQVDEVIKATYAMEGITYIRVWLNDGLLEVGDDIMLVLVGGDIRPHVIDALQYLVGRIKNECVTEIEHTTS